MLLSDAQLRAQFFINSRRFEEAENHLKQSLALDPNDADTLNLLAYCCMMLHKSKEALEHIERAIVLDPANARHFYLRAFISYDAGDYKNSQLDIQKALHFDPSEPEYYSLQSSIYIHTIQFKEALEAANIGLTLDSENLSCLNARTIALLKLKKADAAYETIEKALNYNPSDSQTHTTFGYALLENGESKLSLIHFREALRLNPSNEAARRGIIEAMKSRYLVYRLFLQYAFWLSRLRGNFQWGFILGLFFLMKLIDIAASNFPVLAPYLNAIVFLYAGFAIFTWLIMPISNLFLQMNSFGRFALNKREKRFAGMIGVLLAVGILSVLALLFFKLSCFFYLSVVAITLCLPVAAMQHLVNKVYLQKMWLVVGLLSLIGLTMVVMTILGKSPGILFMIYIFSALGSQILSNYYLSKK